MPVRLRRDRSHFRMRQISLTRALPGPKRLASIRSARHGELRETRTGQDMDQGTRDEMLGRLAEAVESVTVAHPTRVAIDGPPAAGKTTLADELAVVLRAQDRDVIRATIDDFLFPRAQRYPRGEYSAEGCYFDTHDSVASLYSVADIYDLRPVYRGLSRECCCRTGQPRVSIW